MFKSLQKTSNFLNLHVLIKTNSVLVFYKERKTTMADQAIAPVTNPQVSAAPVAVPTEQPTPVKTEPSAETSGSISAATPAPEQGQKIDLMA